MTSSYRVVTNVGEVDWEETDCYAAFFHFVQDAQAFKSMNGMRKARFYRDLGCNEEIEGKIKLQAIYIRHAENLKVPFDAWYAMYTVLSNFPATAPYIIKMSPKTMKEGNKEIGIHLSKCPTHMAHLIMNIVRQYDEAWCPFMRQATKLFPILGVNRSMLFLMMTQMMGQTSYFTLNYKEQNRRPVKLIYGQGYEAWGHIIHCFKYGIPEEALREILQEGSLDYFFRKAREKWDWVDATFNEPDGCIREISDFFSPITGHGERMLTMADVPSPWKREEFINYFNQLRI